MASSRGNQFRVRRRELRKGTHSCWECKRRKMKCVFDPLTISSCNTCRRRGSPCISQDFPEETSLSMAKTYKVGDSTVRSRIIPSMAGEEGSSPLSGPLTPASTKLESSPKHLAHPKTPRHNTIGNDILQSDNHVSTSQDKYERLSRYLHQSLPSREDTEKICKASPQTSVLAYDIMTMPYTSLVHNDQGRPEGFLEIPEPNLHPVLIARHILLLASFLQHLHPNLHSEIKSPRNMSQRLADLAINHVTTKDEILGSIEGLECVIIEGVYHANVGNLRRSWLASRRAMNIAQLMGLDRSDNRVQYQVLDPRLKYQPRAMWFRILFLDRLLCLMLGLPQGCTDRSMASERMLTQDDPMIQFEQIHSVVASRILERNESHSTSHEHALTRMLDLELQKAARSLPSKWWLAPKLEIGQIDSDTLFLNTRRLFAQVLHYNLLNQLHLPYMLRLPSTERKDEYSRITCVNASREVLSRFIALRSFNGIAYSCRVIDFLALMAAMTLLLAHLDSDPSEAGNLLAHQYQSDRAMIEQVRDNMRESNSLNEDALGARSADLLCRLLRIEAEKMEGPPGLTRKVSVHEAGTDTVPLNQSDDSAVSVHIPYFGIIKIAREGMSKEVHGSEATTATHGADRSNTTGRGAVCTECHNHPTGFAMPSEIPNVETMTQVDTNYVHVEASPMRSNTYAKTQAQLGRLPVSTTGANDVPTHFPPKPQHQLFQPIWQYGGDPGLIPGEEDWAFQGVNFAFFESLMSAGTEANVGV